jgi:hypothetical protein
MKRSIQQTSSAAVLGVGAELSRRGYDVTFTLGNTRKVDMLCAVPDGRTFKVQVKGLSNRNGFYIDRSFFEGTAQHDLYLVVVYVPPLNTAGPMEFHVLSHEQAQREYSKMPTHKKDGRPYPSGSGLNWGSVVAYKDAWHTFPSFSVAAMPPNA